jgi:DNA repair protein RecO (recombination protein O)
VDAEKTDAIVIRLADFSNTSRVVTLFTRGFGKVSAIAKGGKRLKGPFDTALDLLSESAVVFLRKSSSALDILTEARLKLRFRPNPANLASFYAGCYIADLLANLTIEDDPHPLLYDAAAQALRQFMELADYRPSLLRFELVMLREIGHLPALDECIQCGGLLDSQGLFSFWVAQGGLLCPQCQKQEYSQHQLHGDAVALMRHLASEHEISIAHTTSTPRQLKEIRHTLTAAISAILGHRPKTLRFLQF